MKTSNPLFAIFACLLLLLFVAINASAQDATATPSPNPLTAEQKALLSEATERTERAVQLHQERKFDEALRLAQRAVELRLQVLGEGNVLVADAIGNVAGIYLARQDFERAEAHIRKALSIYEKYASGSSNMASTLEALSSLRWRVRDFDQAEVYGKRAIELKEVLYGEYPPQVIGSVNNLIRVYNSAGRIIQRNALYLRVISIYEKKKDSIPDKQALFRYHCVLREGNQTPDVIDLQKRIETLLAWDPSKQTPASGGVMNGRALFLPKPAYPHEAKAAGARGVVIVEVVINECGNVVSANVVSGDWRLKSACQTAAMAARFSPSVMSGFPVRVAGIIRYNFTIQ